jgi:hypothetical protein
MLSSKECGSPGGVVQYENADSTLRLPQQASLALHPPIAGK